MSRLPCWVAIASLSLVACGGSGGGGSGDASKIITGAKLPPTGSVTRRTPRLVNYFHATSADSEVSHVEERLAQWDVLALNPDDVLSRGISLARIRAVHPDIRILVWVTFGQQPQAGGLVAAGVPPESDPHNWFARMKGGGYIVPAWGGHLMNPAAESQAWPKYLAAKILSTFLVSGGYDGVMLDILAEDVPVFASSDVPPTNDVNGDGKFDAADDAAWQAGVNLLLSTVRAARPGAILVGNGGVPWSAATTYWNLASGDMHENALGDEFGDSQFGSGAPYGLWSGYQTAMAATSTSYPGLTRYELIVSDVRRGRTQAQASALSALSADDLRRMRVGLVASMLLDGGYFGFDRGDGLHGQLWWFDEYDADLGDPTGAAQAGVYGAGTWRRTFQHGEVILNDGDVARTPSLSGVRDVTTGEVGPSFALPPHDARVYLSTTG